jgi:uncharacterized protein (TIGR02996 family)
VTETCAEEAAFLAAVRADPADDTVRLVYADWLAEHGEPDRAEFIRRQVGGYGPAARKRCRKLLCRHFPRWWPYGWLAGSTPQFTVFVDERATAAIVHGDADWPGQRVVYSRGFVESVSCPARWWLAHGDHLCRHHPVSRASLTTRPTAGQVHREGGATYFLVAGGVERDVRNIRFPQDRTPTVWEMLAADWPRVTFTGEGAAAVRPHP